MLCSFQLVLFFHLWESCSLYKLEIKWNKQVLVFQVTFRVADSTDTRSALTVINPLLTRHVHYISFTPFPFSQRLSITVSVKMHPTSYPRRAPLLHRATCAQWTLSALFTETVNATWLCCIIQNNTFLESDELVQYNTIWTIWPMSQDI